ncbi:MULTISPECIES: hypothetical protein [unclassified Hyphomonas]
MCTHKVRLVSAEDVDSEVRAWLAESYNTA